MGWSQSCCSRPKDGTETESEAVAEAENEDWAISGVGLRLSVVGVFEAMWWQRGRIKQPNVKMTRFVVYHIYRKPGPEIGGL